MTFQLNNQKNASRENMGMFERPGFGSVSFRDSIQTASLFSYDNVSDGINENNINILRKETTENDGTLKLVRFITLFLHYKFTKIP